MVVVERPYPAVDAKRVVVTGGSQGGGITLAAAGLMDEVCPPRTVFAAYNYYAGPKQIKVYEFNHHEGGQGYQDMEKLKFLKAWWK